MTSFGSLDVRTADRARPALLGAILMAVTASFAYAAGWLSPHTLTPSRLVDTFEQVNGRHPGFRRNHAKGVIVGGYFESDGLGSRLSKAAVFQPGRVPVVGRFSLAGGFPYGADSAQSVRSMALRFSLPNGEEWRTGMNNSPVFTANTPEAFQEQLIAMGPDPATGKPNLERVKAFLMRHPESALAIETIRRRTPSSGFGDSTFNSLNAFTFIDAAGRETHVRWSMVPAEPTSSVVTPDASANANYLFDGLIARLRRQPLHWRLVIVIGLASDPTGDATLAWPVDRETVDVGLLTIDRVESEDTSAVRTMNFDPLVLPNGIAGSDDPLLSARSAAYSQSFTRRAGELVSPSAVSPFETGQ